MKSGLILANFFKVMLKFTTFPKLQPNLKLQSPHNCEFFAHCAQQRMWQMYCISAPISDIPGPYRRTRRRLCAGSARSWLSTAGGSPGAAWPRRSEAAHGKSLQRGTAAPLSSPSSFRVCPRERASSRRVRVECPGGGGAGGRRAG